jgi:hypothetical protein
MPQRPQVGDIWRCTNGSIDYYALVLEADYIAGTEVIYLCLRLDTSSQIRLRFANREWLYTKEA